METMSHFSYVFPDFQTFMHMLRKYLKEAKKEECLALIDDATCDMTTYYVSSERRYQEYEATISFYVPMGCISRFRDELKSEILEAANLILPKTAGYYINHLEVRPFSIDTIGDERGRVSAHFKEIQGEIITQIAKAKFLIWIAVSWFTDETLFKHLIAKKKEGVNIQLLIFDDDINAKSGLDYESYLETYRKRPFGVYKDNIMHDKFCIIDLKTVIQGGYNWTKHARFNDEDITIHRNKYALAEAFAERFIELKRSCE